MFTNLILRVILISVLLVYVFVVLPMRVLKAIIGRKLWEVAPEIYRDFSDSREIMRDLLL